MEEGLFKKEGGEEMVNNFGELRGKVWGFYYICWFFFISLDFLFLLNIIISCLMG